jgi:hypothetical protein
MQTALVGHALAARDEIKYLADEFLALAGQTTVSIPNIERLYPYFNPATPPIPDGSAEIPGLAQHRRRWRGSGFLALGTRLPGL